MTILIQILQFVLIISILVVLHELGHFIPAKLFKTKVEKFFLFFDVKFALFKKKIGDTVYGVGWLPLGGYVKISGMIDESMDKEQMKEPPKPWEFRSKPAWQRLIIMVGGVFVNFMLAWIIYSGLLINNGDTYIPADSLKYGIYVDSVGEKLGLRSGDKILAVDGKETKKFKDAKIEILLGDEITVNRDGEVITVQISDEGKEGVFETQGLYFMNYRIKPVIEKVSEGYIAEESGLMREDEIVMINGKSINYWDEFTQIVKSSMNQPLRITVKRNNDFKQINLIVPKEGIIGVTPKAEDLYVTDEYEFSEGILEGFSQTVRSLINQIKQFKIVFNTKTGAYKHIKGPIGIVEMMPTSWDWLFFWNFLALFSVWLAFLNILPIPALDGGHVMFLLYEMVTGRKPSEKVLETGQIIGFVILAGLMLLIFGNDIWNIIKRFL